MPSGAACSNLPAAWAMEPEELKKGFFACYPVLTIGAMLGILAAVLMLIRRWKPIYDDRAQKTWATGECEVVVSTLTKKRQGYVDVVRLGDHPNLQNGTLRAFKWPHQAKHRSAAKMKKMGAWFESKNQADAFLEQ